MSILGYRSRNHPQQVAVTGAKDEVDDRATHPVHFAQFDEEYGPFTLDVAAAPHNAKCDRYFTVEDDGLRQPWWGAVVWCNPPYSSIATWVRKAWHEWEWREYSDRMNPGDVDSRVERIVMLLPANRTEQKWWQDMVERHRDRPGSPLTVRFLPGRMRFIRRGATDVGPNERPPFGCCLLIWQATP